MWGITWIDKSVGSRNISGICVPCVMYLCIPNTYQKLSAQILMNFRRQVFQTKMYWPCSLYLSSRSLSPFPMSPSFLHFRVLRELNISTFVFIVSSLQSRVSNVVAVRIRSSWNEFAIAVKWVWTLYGEKQLIAYIKEE